VTSEGHNTSGNQHESTVLALQDIRFRYPARRRAEAVDALRGVSLVVGSREHIALLGPNGCGKSTLFRIICGLLPPTGGTRAVFGGELDAAARRRLGVVFQHEGLDAHLTVERNLRHHAVLYGMAKRDAVTRIDQLTNAHQLETVRRSLVSTLSGGWARRVDLCRALLHNPDFVLLDEPTVGLDPAARRQFLDQLTALRDEPRAVLMSTHLVDEAERFDRVILMHEGRIVADDSPAALRAGLGARRLTVLDRAWTPPADDRPPWTRTPDGWMQTAGADDAESLRAHTDTLIRAGVPFSVAPPSLDDAFVVLTGARLHDAGGQAVST
jgi:ABC-2 type transport system ATP-binding protein